MARRVTFSGRVSRVVANDTPTFKPFAYQINPRMVNEFRTEARGGKEDEASKKPYKSK